MVDNLVNPMENTLFDLAIIGSGPAGLSAAINATIRKKSILLFGSPEGSKKLISSPRIDNFPESPVRSYTTSF
ncbi:MAG: FAD-binding protein [Carboxydocellales bacterium]